jgi:hypothetical protein
VIFFYPWWVGREAGLARVFKGVWGKVCVFEMVFCGVFVVDMW